MDNLASEIQEAMKLRNHPTQNHQSACSQQKTIPTNYKNYLVGGRSISGQGGGRWASWRAGRILHIPTQYDLALSSPSESSTATVIGTVSGVRYS